MGSGMQDVAVPPCARMHVVGLAVGTCMLMLSTVETWEPLGMCNCTCLTKLSRHGSQQETLSQVLHTTI